MLSQHAVEANHRSGKLDTLSQHTQGRHTIPAYTARNTSIKEAAEAQNSRQADTATSCTTRRARAIGAAEQAATTLQEDRQQA